MFYALGYDPVANFEERFWLRILIGIKRTIQIILLMCVALAIIGGLVWALTIVFGI